MTHNFSRLDNNLVKLLSEEDIDKFTVLELRNSYVDRFGLDDWPSASELRKALYRRLLAMTQRDLLVRVEDGTRTKPTYQKTGKLLLNLQATEPQSSADNPQTKSREHIELSTYQTLRQRQMKYLAAMLVSNGECEEYKRLITDFPNLEKQVEPMYQQARERNSELLGHVRAIDSLLKGEDDD